MPVYIQWSHLYLMDFSNFYRKDLPLTSNPPNLDSSEFRDYDALAPFSLTRHVRRSR